MPPVRQIAADLRRQILAGELPPGWKLPGSRNLGYVYGVNRMTASRAVEQLVSEGLVESRRGSGAYIRQQPPPGATGSALFAGLAPGLPAQNLTGAWVTSYTFSTPARHHADIAHVSVDSGRLTVQNFPPAPRTERHATPFHHTIAAEVIARHVTGYWKNVSDDRYFGTLQLAILPGESMMSGYYTSLDSDVQVGVGPWLWVRLERDSLDDSELSNVQLKPPEQIYELLARHTRYDAGLTLQDITEEG